MKVLFTTNILSFYRVDFFNELGKYCDLTVTYEAESANDRNDNFYKFDNKNFKIIKVDKNPIRIFKILNKEYDIIVIGTYATMISAITILLLRILNKKFIINADGGFINEKTKCQNIIKRFFISKANYWISSGKETNKYLEYYGAKKEKIYSYSFTSLFKKDILDIPMSKSEKNKLRKKYNIPINRKVFITIGRFYYIKGNDIIINSIKDNKFENCEFYIISGGELKEEYQKIIENNNLENVHLIDYLDRKTLYDYLILSDVLIMPSRGDVWGLVINEAMAVGLPIISSNKCIAGIELIDDKYIFDVEKSKQLSELIRIFLNMTDDEIFKIGKNNIRKIKNYTIENMATEHIKIFNEIKESEKC